MFDLNRLIELYNIDTVELGQLLFPTVNYPKVALNRIIRGEAELNTSQLIALTNYLQVPISNLFTNIMASERKNGKITIQMDGYVIKFFEDGFYYTVFDKTGKKIVEVVDSQERYTLPEFINEVRNQIQKANGN